MNSLLFPLAPPAAPIEGDNRLFPVRRIYCVGRNYADHVREMGGTPDSEPPIFFMKPADAIVTGPKAPYPPDTEHLHHEIELVVAIGRGGWDVAADQALDLVFGYAVGIDLTKRDRQAELKAKGSPWERAKSFEGSAPLGPIVPAERIGHPSEGAIELAVNGAMKQKGDLKDMILGVPQIIAEISAIWSLAPGDLIFTGTPDGVGPVARGDRVAGRIDKIGRIDIEIG